MLELKTLFLRPLSRLIPALAALAGLSLLSACVPQQEPGNLPPWVLTSAPAAGGRVVIAGPESFCLDAQTHKTTRKGGFAVLARCDILSRHAVSGGGHMTPAVLTVTVSPYASRALPSASSMAGDFGKDDVLWAADRDQVRLFHLKIGGNREMKHADPRQWRGVFLLNGYLVSMAAYGPKDSRVVRSGGERLLLQMARRISELSPAADRASR